jgi:copper chaperone CopZ
MIFYIPVANNPIAITNSMGYSMNYRECGFVREIFVDVATNRFKVIRFLVEIEGSANELYLFFAEKFPEEKAFWLEIAKEEKDHQTMIRMLGASVAEGQTSFDDKRFSLEEIISAVEEAKKKVARAKTADMGMADALSVGIEFEKNLLETAFFEVFIPRTEGIKALISGIVDATKRHRDVMEKKSREYL